MGCAASGAPRTGGRRGVISSSTSVVGRIAHLLGDVVDGVAHFVDQRGRDAADGSPSASPLSLALKNTSSTSQTTRSTISPNSADTRRFRAGPTAHRRRSGRRSRTGGPPPRAAARTARWHRAPAPAAATGSCRAGTASGARKIFLRSSSVMAWPPWEFGIVSPENAAAQAAVTRASGCTGCRRPEAALERRPQRACRLRPSRPAGPGPRSSSRPGRKCRTARCRRNGSSVGDTLMAMP